MPYSSSIQIVNDANGTAHAFLADNGLLWQCQWNAEAQRWDRGLQIPGAYGARDLQALVVDNLWPSSGISGKVPGNAQGIVLAYRLGNGASSQVMASFGEWGSDGSLSWTEAVPLSNSQGDDEAFALVPSAAGTLRVVLQKREAESSPQELLAAFAQAPAAQVSQMLADLASGARGDSDLYVSNLQITPGANGSYAAELSGNGQSLSTALTQAAAAPVVATPAVAFAGNTQLSRAVLAANAAPSTSPMLLMSSGSETPLLLSASAQSTEPVAFAQQESEQANTQGFGFTRYVQNPLALTGLALFPVRYFLSLRARKTREANTIDDGYYDYDYTSQSEISQSDLDFRKSISEFIDGGTFSEIPSGTIVADSLDTTRRVSNGVMLDNKKLDQIEEVRDVTSSVTSGVPRPSATEPPTASSPKDLVLTGSFGGLLAGRGGYTVINFSRLALSTGDAVNNFNKDVVNSNFGTKLPANDFNSANLAWAFGGRVATIFQYDSASSSSATKLIGFAAQESIGISGLFHLVRVRPNSTLILDSSASFSLLFQQRYAAAEGLSRSLGITGLATGALGNTLQQFANAQGIYGNIRYGAADPSFRLGTTVDVSLKGELLSKDNASNKFTNTIGIGSAALAIGSVVGVASAGMRDKGSASTGVGVQLATKVSLLSQWGVGLGLRAAFQENALWTYRTTGNGAGTGVVPGAQTLFFGSVGASIVGGGFVPLFSMSYASNTKSSSPAPEPSPAPQPGPDLEPLLQAAAPAPQSQGFLVEAPTGARYPFVYAPASASDALLTTVNGPLASLTNRPNRLEWHQLSSFKAAELKSGLLNWANPGADLTDGSYQNVALIGPGLPDSAKATASFRVVNGAIDATSLEVQGSRSLSMPGWIADGVLTLEAAADPNLQSGDTVSADGLAEPLLITGLLAPYDPTTQRASYRLSQPASLAAAAAPTTFEITTAKGQYLALPEGGSGRYVFALNIFQQQPGNPAPPSPASAASAASVFSALPLFSLETSIGSNGSPLQSRQIQRIQQELPIRDLSEGGPYPKADGTTPDPGDYNAYTYLNVPVALLRTDGSSLPIQPFNPDVTATIKLSAGNIIDIKLDQPLYFSKPTQQAGSNSYQLVLDIAGRLGNASLSNPTLLVSSQVESLVDFSDQDSFSPNPTATNAGVYIAAGLSDQLALLPSFARFPVQNRVAYVDGNTIVYLNNTGGSKGRGQAVSSSNLNPENLYNNPDNFNFTFASNPTAITDTVSKTTYVFWVEAAQPVIPFTSGDGEANFQAFMNAIYGNQRIGYSYATTSQSGTNTTWNYVNAADLYASPGNIITDLRSFSVQVSGEQRSLLVWTEVPISALKTAQANPNALFDQQLAVIKVGLINAQASQIPGGYQWDQLFSDANGNSTISTIPWTSDRGSGLSIADLSAATLPVQLEPVARFSGGIFGTTLTVSQLSAGSLKPGDLILGAGVLPGTTITSVVTAATASSPGTYRVSQSHTVASTNLLAVPFSDASQTYSSGTAFDASFSGEGNTTLNVASGLSIALQVGDQLLGVGLEPGTFITAVQAFDPASGAGRFLINRGPATASGSTALLAVPEGTPLPPASQTLLTPVLSWSEAVRTPYNQTVLNSEPLLFLRLGALEPGVNNLNIGSSGYNTETFASDTGLNTSIAGALPKSSASAVQNVEGLGVLSTGLGTLNAQTLEILRNTPQEPANPAASPVAVFSATIDGSILTVSSLSLGTLAVGELLVGDGVAAGTTISEVLTAATTTSPGSYRLSRPSSLPATTTLRTLPTDSQLPLLSFSGSFSGTGGANGYTTLTISQLSGGTLRVGDRVYGLGVSGGSTIEQVQSLDLNSGTAVVTLSQGPQTAAGNYALAASPGGSSSPYTIEFWTKLSRDSNPAGAGLVALGQPSATALPDRPLELPKGWLLSSSFLVERLSWQDAMEQSLVASTPDGTNPTDLYAWNWSLRADGTNTRAMNGNGGSNLYRNALLLDNLLVGDTIEGVNTFLGNYGLSTADLPGLDGTPVDQIALAPSTAFEFSSALQVNPAVGQTVANTSLNGIAIDTSTAVMNTGLVLASQANTNLSSMLDSVWEFQEKTGGPKVLFSLDPTTQTTPPPPSQPARTRIEQYGGYALNFALGFGPAVSVNGDGQIAFDVAPGQTLISAADIDYRDDSWHYVVASFLPEFITYSSDEGLLDLPRNVGTANLYIDGRLVNSQASVIDPFSPNNNNDQAQLLSDNSGGALDLLALYNTALTTSQPPAVASDWPVPTSAAALDLIKEAGFVIASKTPNPGEQPGAVSNHWLARTVDPNNAVNNTFTSVLLPDAKGGLSWSEASNINPQLAISPTKPSASNASLQEQLLITINAGDWSKQAWYFNNATKAEAFNPAGRTLEAITVTLTPPTSSGGTVLTRTLTPEQVLLGTSGTSLQSLAALQLRAQDQNFLYTFLSNKPALNLLISREPQDASDSNSLDPKLTYTTTVSLEFTDGSQVSVNNNPIAPATDSSSSTPPLVGLGLSTSLSSQLKTDALSNSNALATAEVVEQAPLQLKYVNSGVILSSQNSAEDPSPASTFANALVYGYYDNKQTSETNSGWLALSQPSSTNAVSDPAGRVWIQAVGQFKIDPDSKLHVAVSDAKQNPKTWLNALADSNFSPDSPNLPLLNSALYPSSVGGLLIKADATAGWGQNFGDTMLVADVNNDGILDLVISAPQANAGGAVVIVDGSWIAANLNSSTGQRILDLSNPTNYGDVVTVLRPGIATTATDITSNAGFGTALAFQKGSGGAAGTLWIGAPNYLRTLDATNPEASTQPIGALYSYTPADYPGSWGTATITPLSKPILGSGGTLTSIQPGNSQSTDYWGAQLGTAVAISSTGELAVSAPGVTGSMVYSGTDKAQKTFVEYDRNYKDRLPEGLLNRIQVGGTAIDTPSDVNSTKYTTIATLQADQLTDNQLKFLTKLREMQLVQIASATTLNNQAVQAAAVGAVMRFNNNTNFAGLANAVLTPAAVAALNGETYYGPNPYNTLGDSGFGSSITFADLTNTNREQLIIGADKTGGGGVVYMIDPSATPRDGSLGNRQQLALLAATNLFVAGSSGDDFGNGLVNLGDVNQDGYQDLLIQAYNAASGAGTGSVLFGTDQLSTTASNQGLASMATGLFGKIQFTNGNSDSITILRELGSSGGFTGQGSYGPGDFDADGINDIPLSSGANAKGYLTWGKSYLEAINNLQLERLTSDNGFILEGLASTTEGSLRSIGDFNGDGYGDFFSIKPGNALTTIRIELGANTQEILANAPYNYYTFTVANGTQILPAGDLNGDGMDDIALFFDRNLSSNADGNQGAGSTTGILYGRSSSDLPIGSSLGFLAPVDPTTSAPLESLPGVNLAGGLTDTAPSVIAVGNTLYAAVKGVGSNSTSLWFSQSLDGGNSWDNWTNLSEGSQTFALKPGTSPSLAFSNNRLYLGFVNGTGTLSLSSWDPRSNNPLAWSTPSLLSSSSGSSAFSSSQGLQLVDRGDALGVLWVNGGMVQAASSTTPVTTPATSPWEVVNGRSSLATPALARFGDTTYMAVQGGSGDSNIYWTSSVDGGASWAAWRALPNTVTSQKPPSLAVVNGTLYLSYLTVGTQQITISSLTDATANTWSTAYQIPVAPGSGTVQRAQFASLASEAVNGSEQLAVYYVSVDSSNRILKTQSSTPATRDGWSPLAEIKYSTSGVQTGVQTASGPLTVGQFNGQTYLAYQGGTLANPDKAIYIGTSRSADLNNGSTWAAQRLLDPGQRTGLGLSNTASGLQLTYSAASQKGLLQLLNLTPQAGSLTLSQAADAALPLPAGLSSNITLLNGVGNGLPNQLFAGLSTSNAVETSLVYSPGVNSSWSTPLALQQLLNNEGVDIAADATPSFTWLGTTAVLAVKQGASINVYAALGGGSSLQLTSSFSPQPGGPAIASAPVITSTDTGLALTYTNSDGSITLQRLNLLNANGTPVAGVQFKDDGSIDVSKANLQWLTTTLDAGTSGISSSLASTPVSVDGTLLLANVRNSTSANTQIWVNAVPNSSDPDSTTWLNTTVQLPDGKGGWAISQQAGAFGVFDPGWQEPNGGLSPWAPSFAELNGVLYSAVRGWNSADNNKQLYWNRSTDNGRTWSPWQQLPGGMTSDRPPTIAAWNGQLYLVYIGQDNAQSLNITKLENADANQWAPQIPVRAGVSGASNQTAEFATLVDEGNQLALYYVGTGSNELYSTSSTDPYNTGKFSTSTLIKYNSNGGIQTASGPLAATRLNGQTYLAYQGGTYRTGNNLSGPSNQIFLTTGSANDTNWSLLNPVPQPASASHTGVGLTANSKGLLLSYSDVLYGKNVVSVQQGTGSGTSWSFSPYTLLQTPGNSSARYDGANSLYAETSGEQVLVSTINPIANEAITNAWVNPTPVLTPGQTGSTLTPVGDLDNDGFADLLLTANNVVANAETGFKLATGLRVISGAATSSQILTNNDNTAPSQSVQLAAPFNRDSSATPVSSITGADPANGNLNLEISARSGAIGSVINATVSAGNLTSASGSVAEASALLSGLNPSTAALAETNGWGQQAFNSAGSYGDLNGDGRPDFFDPAGSVNIDIDPLQQLNYSLWSIRAAGDVNGNGVDDVIITLAPQGPGYALDSNGLPTALQSALLDGSLFYVNPTSNTFSLAKAEGSFNEGWTSAGLKTPLNPYNRNQLYNLNSEDPSAYAPNLQNWFEPILSYKAGELTSASTQNTTIPNSAQSYTAPAAAVSDNGQAYLVFSGKNLASSGAGLWMAYQNSSGNWTQSQLPIGNDASYLSPSAVFYKGKLVVAYTDVDRNLNVAWCEDDPGVSGAVWNSYQVIAESSQWNPTLVVEQGRLALYFPSNAGGTRQQTIRYLYSTDPLDKSANGNWGASLNSTGDGYSGISGTLSDTSGSNLEITSPIAATTYQGRTVLAFRGYNGSLADANIWLATQVEDASTATVPGRNLSWVGFNTNLSDTNGVGLASDQSTLYLTSTTSAYGTFYQNPQPQMWSLNPKEGFAGNWLIDNMQTVSGPGYLPQSALQDNPLSTNKYNNGYGGAEMKISTALVPYLANGRLYATWSGSTGTNPGPTATDVEVADLSVTLNPARQKSLAGYSIDGNIDINGDGFKDILLSDPSDPKQNVDNQYALFGGDYLNIASQVGTPGNDVLVGTSLADVIYTIQGADQVNSNGGADVIYTGAGDDAISIADNAFIRIDAGSGFDVLRLQGRAGQSYDFRLNEPSPEYFAGPQLRDIELISSQDYGTNTLRFDAAAVNAINPDRVLFLTPDASDTINLTDEFQRNPSFDTSYGGGLWYAYAAGGGSVTTANPTLIYVRVPDGSNAITWLASQVIVATESTAPLLASSSAPLLASSSAAPAGRTVTIPSQSLVAGSNDFGNGLRITAYKSTPNSGTARFTISRNGDLSRSQLVSYVSSSQESSAGPGRDYTPVAGLLRLEEGQAEADITVPINAAEMVALRNGTLSMQVAELDDIGQKQLHLLLEVDHASNGSRPTLSGLNLQIDPASQTASIGFRADINKDARAEGLASTLNLNVLRRQSANSSTTDLKNRAQKLVLSEGLLAKFDRDGSDNGQVELQFDLNAATGAIQLQAANLGLRPLVLSKLDLSRQPITLGIDLTTTSLDSLLLDTPPKGVVLNKTAVDFTVKADADGKAKIFLDLTQVGNDLEIIETKDGAKPTRKPNHQLLYHGIDADGALSDLTYNARRRTGARFYDTNGDDIADFVSLTFEDGGMGDTGPSGDGLIHDPSVGGFSNLTDVVLTAIDQRTLQAASMSNKDAPASLVLRANLSSRPASSNHIYYVVHDPSDSSSFDSIFTDLTLLRERAQTLYSSLESTDVTLAPGTSFSRDILLINGQHVRFFEVEDGSLNQLSSAKDARLRVLSTAGISRDLRSVNAFSSSGVSLSLALLDGDQGLNALIGQEQGLAAVLDFTSFAADQKVEGVFSLAREASFDAVTGFYRTLDLKGTVWLDPSDQAKGTIAPGQAGTTAADYGAAALRNMVDSLTGLSVGNGQTSSSMVSLQESTYLAPIARVNGHTFVSFDKGNTDGISHFVTLGTNTFGLEDLHGGGDKDYDDQVISFVFSKVVNPVV